MTQIIGISGHARGGKDSTARYIEALVLEKYFRSFDVAGKIVQGEFFEHIIEEDDTDVVKWHKNIHFLFDSNFWDTKNSFLNQYCKIYSFAKPIKDFCIDVLGLTEKQVNGTNADKITLTKYLWDNLPEEIRLRYSIDGSPRVGFMTAREVMQVFGTDIMRNYFSESIWVDSLIERIKKDNARIALITDVRFISEVDVLIKNKAKVIRLSRRIDKLNKHKAETELLTYNWSNIPKNDFLFVDNENMTMQEKNLMMKNFILTVINENS